VGGTVGEGGLHQKVVEEAFTKPGGLKYRTYAVSTLRGGLGKSTLAFNLAYELASSRSLLIGDLCPQCNLTETLMRGADHEVSILSALTPMLLGPAFGSAPEDLSYRISTYCDPFKLVKPSYVIPGDPQMFAFPSTLYQQLQTAHAQNNPRAVRALLECLKTVLERERKRKRWMASCWIVLLCHKFRRMFR
jgi:chromosome partitioning protein